MTDHEAIRQILYRYARGLDRLDRDLIRACYHDDAIDSRPPLFDGHVDAFIDWVLQLLSAMDSSIHSIGNILIECADDVAAVESYFVATLRARTPHGWTETIRNGRYIDDFRRRDGRWAIARRLAIIDASRSHSIADGAADIMLPGAASGAQHPTARDRSDISYALFDTVVSPDR